MESLYIFDLDGVLTKTAIVHRNAWFDTLREVERQFSVKFTGELNEEYYLSRIDGKPRDVGMRAIFDDLGVSNVSESVLAEYCQAKNTFFLRALNKISSEELLFYDTLESLNKGDIANSMRAVATSSKNGRAILEKCNLLEHFSYIADGNTVENLGINGKPSPDIFDHVIERFGQDNKRCVIVEDSTSGVIGALASKTDVVYWIKRNVVNEELRFARELKSGRLVIIQTLMEVY